MSSNKFQDNSSKHPQDAEARSDEEYSEYSTTSSNNDSEYLSHIKSDGNIYYVKCSIVPTLNRIEPGASEDDHALFRSEYKRMSLRGPAKLMVRKMKDKNPFGTKVVKKTKFAETDKCVKEVILSINLKKVRPLNGVKFLERVLGIVPSVSLAKKLVVAQVKENCCFSKDGFVKPGDVLKSIGPDSITNENLDNVLKNLNGSQLKICFHEMLENSPLNSIDVRITGLSDILDNLHLLFGYEKTVSEIYEYPALALMFISKQDDSDSLTPTFSFPNKDKNVLFSIRGSFMTLQSIFDDNFQCEPKCSTFKVHRALFHVTYKCLQSGLLLLGFNARHVNLFEAKQHSNNFIETLKFIFKTEIEAFTSNNIPQLQQLCELKQIELITSKKSSLQVNFETILPQPQYVALPKEIQLRIDDAISELEAMDFFNWTDSETVIDALQDLVIIGCALYYKNFLISSHLSGTYVQEIENTAKHLAIHGIMDSTNVKKLIVWQEIFPQDEPRNDKKKFVIFTSQGKLLLVAIVEEKIAKKSRIINLKTSLSYYVEEMQDILEYFRLTGVENLTRIWISSNKRPEILQPSNNSTQSDSVSGSQQQKSSGPASLRDSNANSDDSDSDWEEGLNSGRGSSSGFDMSECSDIIYKDFQEIIPSVLNTNSAENLIFHYIQIEFGDGVLIAPTVQSNFTAISNVFRKTCVIIHQVLQNTVKFRKILANNELGQNWNRSSMVAIKEHGVLIQVQGANSVTSGGGNKNNKIKSEEFWVIGRLFSMPPRELYVCHRTSTPQNMVELAFKIRMGGAG
uniref:CSON007352 protein n=1 Tax=Culicoides sonorensis TaxID=179676 RepID=A0A336LXM1_CULSO